MKNLKYSRVLSLFLALALLIGVSGALAERSPTAADTGSPALEKEETVYVLTGADGAVNQVIVSDWLKNPEGAGVLRDRSDLTDIENVKGDETCSDQGDGDLTWAANGADIYYQGTSQKALPLEVKVTYTLDGKEVSPQDLRGKSGRVTIRFDYQNNEKRTVNVGGRDRELYVPFTAATGLFLDGEHFRNVTVTNGKVLSDGSRYIVAGLALPGLRESLGLTDGDLALPDYVEVQADATDFALTTAMTVVLSDVLGGLDLTDIEDAGDLADSLNRLADAAEELEDGSKELLDGLTILQEKSSGLTGGIDQLVSGSQSLREGAGSLAAGTDQLCQGAKALGDGAVAFAGGLDSAKAGADQLKQGADSLTGGADQLAAGAASAQAGLSDLSAGIDSARESLNQTIAGNEQVLQGLRALAAQMPSQELNAMIATLETTIAGQKQIAGTMADGSGGLKDGAAQLSQGAGQLSQGAAALKGGLQQLSQGADSLSQGMQELQNAGQKLKQGGENLSSAGRQVSSGARALDSGSQELASGLGALQDGSGALADGVSQLVEGAGRLASGMAEFNETGIQRLVDVFDGGLEDLVDRLQALKDLGESYTIFTQLADSMTGSVKFVYKTEEI